MPAGEGYEGVADFLAAGEWAAFHGRPGSGVTGLEHALTDRTATQQDLAKARWLLGVCLGADGRYGDALATLAPLAAAPQRGDRWASFAASTTGSLHRQLGRYAVAREYDRSALAAAEALPPHDVEPLADAWLGLAADAVGDGDAAAARKAWEPAAVLAEVPDAPWRPRVRAAWVAAEIALLSHDAPAALKAADDAVRTSDESRAPRHHAKSLVFRAVASREARDLQGAATAARRALAQAVEIQVLPVVWPAGTLLAEIVLAAPDVALYPREGERAIEAARRAVGRIASGLPDGLAGAWLRRPGVPDPYEVSDDPHGYLPGERPGLH